MRKPFEGDFPITQVFGVNPANYAQFGLAGHNGIDYGLPCGTKVVSAITGIVKQVAFETGGYGNYIQIENNTEGFVVAHLTQAVVGVGQHIDEGQVIGWSGTTGNSTGCHLHFGYYRFPRDRQNGFNGYIDPAPHFSDIIVPEPVSSAMNDQTIVSAALNGSGQDLEIQQIRGLLKDGALAKIDLENTRQENTQLKTTSTQQETTLTQLQTESNKLTADLTSCLSQPSEAPKTAGSAFSLLVRLLSQGKF